MRNCNMLENLLLLHLGSGTGIRRVAGLKRKIKFHYSCINTNLGIDLPVLGVPVVSEIN